MEELIQKLQTNHGLTAEQSRGILNTITGFIKEKFPMVAGAVDNLFQSGTTPSDVNETQAGPNSSGSGDFMSGNMAQSIEEMAKEKLGGFFGGNKNG
jgi:hypothetical protein